VQTGRVFRRDDNGRIIGELRLGDTLVLIDRKVAADFTTATVSFWVSEYSPYVAGYRVLHVDTTGRSMQRFWRAPADWQTQAPWPTLTAAQARTFVPPDTMPRPSSAVADLRYGTDGLLRVLVTSPRADWKAVKEENRWASTYFATIEVIAPNTGQLIGSARVPGHGVQMIGTDVFVTYRDQQTNRRLGSISEHVPRRPSSIGS